MKNEWPKLSYEKGKDTYNTLHLWTQIVGKIMLSVSPWINHSWHIALHLTPTGLSTHCLPYEDTYFQIDFDFFNHKLKVTTSEGQLRDFDLMGNSVADFYQKIFALLGELNIHLKINSTPVEMENPIPFEKDTKNTTYNKSEVLALHRALLDSQKVLIQMRCNFKGKCSPVHFFWGSFDMAVSRFSGRKAPPHPGGIPYLADCVTQEAYSHEVASCGFWPGSEALPEAAFYAYVYPAPNGYKDVDVEPKGAYFHEKLREFILPYIVVQASDNPEETLLQFLNSTYQEGATLAGWDKYTLET